MGTASSLAADDHGFRHLTARAGPSRWPQSPGAPYLPRHRPSCAPADREALGGQLMTARADGSWAVPARNLYLVAMAMFVVTIAIGILNGSDVVEFDNNQILTHVHSGTIGWITLGVVATAFVLFRMADRRLALILMILVPLYVAAFYTGNFSLRAIGGVALLAAVAWLFVWLWRTYLAGERTLPRLAMTLGLTTFTYGAVVGVVLQIQFALGASWLSGDSIGAHAAAMVFGYLVLVSMGLIEWRVRGSTSLSRGGVVQIGALFVGGLILSVGLLTGTGQAAGGLYLLCELIAVILFVVRVLPASVRLDWTGASPARHIGAASIWVLVAMGIFMVLIAAYISANGDASKISRNILIASDHSVFVGVMTNVAFGLLGGFVAIETRARRGALVAFWGINLGLVVFVLGLLGNSVELKRLGAPVMGVFLLYALAVYGWALWQERTLAPDAVESPASA